MENIRIALTKGRLEKDAIGIFDGIGIDTTELKNKGRKLILKSDNYPVEFVLAKAQDVITYVEHGVVDMGIVGKDTILENTPDFYEVIDLNKGKCFFALASLESYRFIPNFKRKVIATKYPKVAHDYFREKGEDVEIIKIEGSVELAPILGLADAIVDIVETGTTLKENGLIIFDKICDISARLIVNKASMKMKKNIVLDLVDKIEDFLNSSEGEANND
ncbi:ATP phosphoribosyltransferase [Clostridium folliculivorans]|uniref:ATP phosphoribosyltransferase n=1 Tax=Clostridium folliculivorans TaxID=2886038 RepID=A0A9W6DC17_9CLOT|nr:ATP phosphoribosyltransferase [Clostridium folliculivorans]GKU26864.1 ATP phosphoribosyltransferase [Clostridium folliculivorans]GKU31515.1 ATP phosphoribosyltransferase [Clostridium folliculivorans]